MRTFWDWERGILEEEELYWENLLRDLKITIDSEAQKVIASKEDCSEEQMSHIRSDINGIYQKKK